jgi:hypothetical protein
MIHIPGHSGWTRLLAIIYGLVVFFWMGPEDNTVWPVALLGAVGSSLTVLLWTLGRLGGRDILARHLPLLSGLMGAASGLGAGVLSALLMLFKNARHAHLFPDYPAGLLGAMIALSPAWALAGGLIGAGCGLVWLALYNPPPPSHTEGSQSAKATTDHNTEHSIEER